MFLLVLKSSASLSVRLLQHTKRQMRSHLLLHQLSFPPLLADWSAPADSGGFSDAHWLSVTGGSDVSLNEPAVRVAGVSTELFWRNIIFPGTSELFCYTEM